VAEFGGVNYVITGGGEGQIRIWRFDPTASKFELLSSFDGHIREVTCLYLQGELLAI
jgi:WD40 repeat protein